MKVLPIEWAIDRNNMYVNIDCYRINEKGESIFSPEICRECISGCNIEPLDCDPEKGLRVQVYDKGGKLLTQSEWIKNIQKIRINKNSLGNIRIEVE